MYLKTDAEFGWRPARIYIPAWQFSGLDYETTTATDIKSIGTGTGNDMAITNINTSGVTAINMANAADSVEHLMCIPGDMDLSKKIFFRVYWTANNTSGSATWAVKYKAFIAGTTVLGTAKSATALDNTIAAQTMAAVAYTLMQSPEGSLNGETLAKTTEMLQLGVIISALTTITTASFLGLEIRYTPKRLTGPDGMRHDAKAPIYIASNTFAIT